MLVLARHVYPLYDHQLKGGGVAGQHYLEDYLHYVAKRYTPNADKRKRNVGRYLEVAADGYLNEVGRQSRDFSHGKNSPSIL